MTSLATRPAAPPSTPVQARAAGAHRPARTPAAARRARSRRAAPARPGVLRARHIAARGARDRRRPRRLGAGPTPRHAADAARPRRRRRPADVRLRRRLARPARRELRTGLDRRHRRGHDRRRPAPRRRRPHRDRRAAAGAPPPRARLAARPRRRLARRRPRLRHTRRPAVRDGPDGHARPALGDPGDLARHPPPGGHDRDRGRAQAVRLVRPVAQPHGRAAQPRLGRQPRTRRRARPHARPPRLRRARVRQPRQRRERGPLQRARLQRPARHRRRDAVAHPAARRGPQRIAGFGSSLGAEVLLEAAARDPGCARSSPTGPTRPMDAHRVGDPAFPNGSSACSCCRPSAASRACARRRR